MVTKQKQKKTLRHWLIISTAATRKVMLEDKTETEIGINI